MVQTNYIQERDELEIVFKEVDVPEIIKTDDGITFEFDSENLSAIILPYFGQMIYRQLPHIEDLSEASIIFEDLTLELLKLKINDRNINVKINLKDLENS